MILLPCRLLDMIAGPISTLLFMLAFVWIFENDIPVLTPRFFQKGQMARCRMQQGWRQDWRLQELLVHFVLLLSLQTISSEFSNVYILMKGTAAPSRARTCARYGFLILSALYQYSTNVN